VKREEIKKESRLKLKSIEIIVPKSVTKVSLALLAQ
jgi:hypothetical protein